MIDLRIIHRYLRGTAAAELLSYAGDPVRRTVAEFAELAPRDVRVSTQACHDLSLPKITFEFVVTDPDVWWRLTEDLLSELKHHLLIILGDRLPIQAHEAETAVVKA